MISRFVYGVIEFACTNESYGPIHFVFPIMVPLNGFAYMCSTYLTVLLTFERYIAICHPYKVNLISKGKTWKYIRIIILFAFVWNIPKCIAYEWKDGYAVETRIALSWMFLKGYLLWGSGIVKFVIPLLLLVTLNVFVVKEVKNL